MKTLIKNGTVVNLDRFRSRGRADRRRDDRGGARAPARRCSASTSRPTSTTVIDAGGKLVIPGGIDAHTHMEMPFGGTFASDTLRDGNARGGLGRHDLHRRLRGAVSRPEDPRPVRAVAREGRGQLRESTYRLPPDPVRRAGCLARRHGRAHRGGRDELQALHGLQGRVPLRRRADPPGVPEGRLQRRAHDDARRERRHDRRPREAGHRGRQHHAVLPRAHAALAGGGGGHAPRDHDRRPYGRPRSMSCT